MQKMKYLLLSAILLVSGAFTSCNNARIDVMVVGVNNGSGWEETSVLIESLKNKKENKIDNISFHTGKIDNKNIVVAESPIGTSEAAMTTTIGIKQYHPKYVISEGTAGGHHKQIGIHDIVLGKDILDMASFQGPGDDPSQWVLQHPTLHSDENLLKIASEVKFEKASYIEHNGIISSCDCWNTDADFVKKLHEKYNEDCEEMESYAVRNVTGNYKIPFLGIRLISNNMFIEPFEPEKAALARIYVQEYTIEVIKAI